MALVTGAGSGIGEAVVIALAREGAKVVLTDVDLPGAERVAALVKQAGGETLVVRNDVSSAPECEAAVAAALKTFGRLDIAVNNAGIGYLMEPLVDMAKERWQAVLEVNLMGAFLCTKHAARQMIRQGGGGRIINIASVAAKVGSMHLAGYAASKHGMLGLTRSAAIELGAHGITVNAICPNHVTTGLGSVQNEYRSRQRGQSVDEYLAEMRSRIPLGRVGWAEDTAKACAFLCSDEACYVTAEAMNVSGGQEMH